MKAGCENTEISKLAIIIICGFSGAGKSTFLQKLILGKRPFKIVDLDQFIFQELSTDWKNLAEYIEKEGELKFRNLEFLALQKLLKSNDPKESLAIALGGGALTDQTWKILKKHREVKLLWLNTPFAICWDRIKNDLKRPLTRLGKKKMRELYQQRLPFFKKAQIQLDIKMQNLLKSSDDLLHYL